MTLQEQYEKLVSDGAIKGDSVQLQIVAKLENLRNDIEVKFRSKNSVISKILSFPPRNHNIPGMYIHGAVGRGKSMLMDLFFSALNIIKKQRQHFHEFMLDIHNKLHKWRQENRDNPNASDPIPILAKNLSKTMQVLCLDELQVSDITDAMILGRLFAELFKNGVIIIATSNIAPDELYKDGLQRERFVPFIEIIKEKLTIAELTTREDYRLGKLKGLQKAYYWPLDKNAAKFMAENFVFLSGNATPQECILNVTKRKIIIKKSYKSIGWVSFKDLCEKPLGAVDYIEIAQKFSTLLLEDIPQMSKEQRNEAKRFVTLIDVLYEHKVKLIATAAVAPDLLYTSGTGSFEFSRTVSRLIEMQSEQYLLA